MTKDLNLQSLFCGILFCISITALIIACLAFTKKGGGKGEYYKGTTSESNDCDGDQCSPAVACPRSPPDTAGCLCLDSNDETSLCNSSSVFCNCKKPPLGEIWCARLCTGAAKMKPNLNPMATCKKETGCFEKCCYLPSP